MAFEKARERMITAQLRRRGVRDIRVLDAMASVPREAFVSAWTEEFAYEDGPLPIGEGQTISQPYIVAMMAEAAKLEPGNRGLEVGAGSGYAAAIFSRLADQIFAIERHASLTEAARALPRAGLSQHHIQNRRRQHRLAGRSAVRCYSGGSWRAGRA
jgi:protein-L-isoaspartate(D-aspartate) O-methyltransferase